MVSIVGVGPDATPARAVSLVADVAAESASRVASPSATAVGP
jgi:hypothetical protein